MKTFLKVLWFPIKIILFLLLPFIILIRGSVFLYGRMDFTPWLLIGISALGSMLLVLIYLQVIRRRILGKRKNKEHFKSFKRSFLISGALVLTFTGYCLIYVSADNAKNNEIREEYTALHPILRMAVSTFILVDQDIMITDLSRTHSDYADMGLKTLKNSLHYPQSTGYVHAIDLRTRDRSEFRNQLLELSFKAMGFSTLRHIGTADHLHVSLYIKENPDAL